jgi:hypothetical protein
VCFDAVGHLAITGFGRRDEQDVGPADPLGQLLREAALTTASSPEDDNDSSHEIVGLKRLS